MADVQASGLRPQATLQQRFLVVTFVFVIALPLAVNLAGGDGADAGAENRALASFPPLAPTRAALLTFPAGVDAWFQDHFGLRATLVRWYGRLRLEGLNMSPTASVVRGKDGWLFYADDDGLADYVSEHLLSDDELAIWREAILRARDWLTSRRIAYVFTIAPDKHVIYPEWMPDPVRPLSRTRRMDQLFEALADTRVSVDLRPALLEAKAHERLYHRTDTHWNARGAYVAYREIIEAVRREAPLVPPPWDRSAFRNVSRDVEALDLAGMIGLKRVLREAELGLDPIRPRKAHVVEPPGAAPTAEEGLLITEIPGSTLPRAVIFRDSFASALVPFLAEHFSRAVFMWQNDFDANAISREQPDVVIQEIVGRHLYNFAPSPELVP